MILIKKSTEKSVNGLKYHHIKCTHFNAQDLTSKFAELAELLANEDYDIVAITESWLVDEISVNEFTPDGWTT